MPLVLLGLLIVLAGPGLFASDPPVGKPQPPLRLPGHEGRNQSWGGSTTVYFGNGCFWERQYAYVNVEQGKWGRGDADVSSVVGYAGGKGGAGPDGKVCYHHSGAQDDVYSSLGHA